jgi:DNA-binding FadR family transcriptional regulator
LRRIVEEHAAMPERPLPTERHLSARLGVSRRAVRHALATLEAEGKIWRRQGKGTFIGPAPALSAPTLSRLASRTNFYEIMEVRLHLEPSIAQLAAHRASAEQIALISRMAERLSSYSPDTDPATLERWDSAFHRSLAEACGNRLFLDLFEVIDRIRNDAAWQSMRARARTPGGRRQSARQHLEIAAAVAARDAARAATVMRQHVALHQENLLRAMHGDGDPALVHAANGILLSQT